MKIEFVKVVHGPERLVAEAELHFEEGEPLAGLKLCGFSLWRGGDDVVYVTGPSRAFGVGTARKFFDYVRVIEGGTQEMKVLKGRIVQAYKLSAGEGV